MNNHIKKCLIYILILSISVTLLTSCGQEIVELNGKQIDVNTFFDYQTEITQKLKDKLEEDYSIDNPYIEVNPYGNTPLSAIIIFTTDKSEEITLTVNGKNEASTYTSIFEGSKRHVLPVYGLYLGTKTHVTITSANGLFKDLYIKTDNIKTDLTNTNILKADNNADPGGMYFAAPYNYNPDDGIQAVGYDCNGDIRWMYKGGDTSVSYLTHFEEDRFLMTSPYAYTNSTLSTGVIEYDLLGKVYREYKVPGGIHDDFAVAENGDLWVLQGNNNQVLPEDKVVKINRKSGEIVDSINLSELLDVKRVGKSVDTDEFNWSDIESVMYDKYNKLVVISAPKIDAVLAIEPGRKPKIKWILGDSSGWSSEYTDLFLNENTSDFEFPFSSDSLTLTSDGQLMLFDRGKYRTKDINIEEILTEENNYSRAVKFNLYTNENAVVNDWTYGKDRKAKWYSYKSSSVQEIDEGRYLIDSGSSTYDYKSGRMASYFLKSGRNSSICEITVDDLKEINTVFEMYVGCWTQFAFKYTLRNEANYDLSSDEYKCFGNYGIEEFGNVEVNRKSFTDEEYPYPLEVSLTNYALTVKGTLNETTLSKPTEIMLVSTDNDIALTKTIYQDSDEYIFASEQYKFTSTVSLFDLDGTYDIIIHVDGKYYDIGKQINC